MVVLFVFLFNYICCGRNDFQDYFDDVKELRVNGSKDSWVKKLQESSFKELRFKNNQDQDSRIKRKLYQDKY